MVKIGIINVSDRASAGIYEDIPGKAVVGFLTEWLSCEWEPVYRVIPDEQDQLEATMIELADRKVAVWLLQLVAPAPPYGT